MINVIWRFWKSLYRTGSGRWVEGEAVIIWNREAGYYQYVVMTLLMKKGDDKRFRIEMVLKNVMENV
jgi:hypothetical protein